MKTENINVPLFVYYPINRMVHDIPLRIRKKHSFKNIDAYDESLTNKTNFRDFFEWFRDREDIENECMRNIYETSPFFNVGSKQLDTQLEAVRGAIYAFITNFSELKIQRKPQLRMMVTKNAKKIMINQLSNGEKCLLALIGDLARRLVIANPMHDTPLRGKGVVLIDEVALHLHPTWQHMIIPCLLETFPHCQFLMTTNSPHVLTHVPSNNVFLFDNVKEGLKVLRPNEMYGKTSESILKTFMGLESTRPKHIAEDLHQIFIDIQKKELVKAQERIHHLTAQIGDDPELVKARALVRRMESIGK